MKKRNGFVSNSSSSSFIIGIAKVNDIEKCRKYIADNKIDDDVEIRTYKELKESDDWSVTVREGKSIQVESFDGATVSLNTEDFKGDEYVLTYCFFGNEGDGYFYEQGDDDDWSEPNYDRVYDDNFFNKTEEDAMTMLGSGDTAGIEKCNYTIGASRNG